jgi:hypothetical protein
MNASRPSDKAAKKPKSDAEQAKAFRKAARELEADESEERFQDALRKVAKAKPQPLPPKKSKRA